MGNTFPGGRAYHVRYEGTAATSGPIGSPTIVLGFSFYEQEPSIIYFTILNHNRVDGVSGICTSSDAITTFTPSNSASYKFNSDTNTLTNIPYFDPQSLSSLPGVLWDLNTTPSPDTSPAETGTQDDNNVRLNIPWNITYLGNNYPGNQVYLGSNTYLTFGSGSNLYNNLSFSNPYVPKIMIGCGDNSFQRVYATSASPPYRDTVAPTLGSFDMTRTYGDGAFTITQPSSNSAGSFTYSITGGSDVISLSGTTITILKAGSATVQASQAAEGRYLAATQSATITINRLTASLSVSQNIFIQKFVSDGVINFDVISSNAGQVSRTYQSNNTGVIAIPNSANTIATIVAPGKTTINVSQPQTTNYEGVNASNIITMVVVGQGTTYSSENMTSLDLSGTNLSGSVFSGCILTGSNLFGTVINGTTDFSSATLQSVKSGRISGITTLFPLGYMLV